MATDRRVLVTKELERGLGAYRLTASKDEGRDTWHWSFIAEGGVRCTLDLQERLLDPSASTDAEFQAALSVEMEGLTRDVAEVIGGRLTV